MNSIRGLTGILLAVVLCCLPGAWADDKKEADDWVSRGLKHADKKEFADAERCYRKALELNPKHGAAHGCLSFVYLNTERFRETIEAATAATQLLNRHPGVFLNRAEAYRRLGQHGLAITDCKLVMTHKLNKIAPTTNDDVAMAFEIQAACHDALKMPERAKADREQAKKLRAQK